MEKLLIYYFKYYLLAQPTSVYSEELLSETDNFYELPETKKKFTFHNHNYRKKLDFFCSL